MGRILAILLLDLLLLRLCSCKEQLLLLLLLLLVKQQLLSLLLIGGCGGKGNPIIWLKLLGNGSKLRLLRVATVLLD